MTSNTASCLFHYANDINVIQNIIVNGLYPNFCAEELTYNGTSETVGIPMVSFCDIPLKRVRDFTDRYGTYALGFSKEWGISNDINPIFYAANENIVAGIRFYRNYQNSLSDELKKYGSDGKSISFPLRVGQIEGLADFINYNNAKEANSIIWGLVKSYYGEHKGMQQCNYIESEWRYVIKEGSDIKWIWGKNEYEHWRGIGSKPAPSSALLDRRLHFRAADISYIIIDNENERLNMINWIDKLSSISDGNALFEEDKKILISRIISMEQINRDF